MTSTSATLVALPGARRRPRATWADVGCSRFALVLLALNGVLVAFAVGLFSLSGLGLGLDTRHVMAHLGLIVVPLGFWAYYAWMPGTPREWIIPQAILVFVLVRIAGAVGTPLQYAAAALNQPTIDPLLARADAWLGVSVPAVVAWTATQPWLVAGLSWAYFTFVYQVFLTIFVLAWWNDSEAIWEFAFHMIVCGLITIVTFTFWPAAGVFSELGFQSLLDQTRFLAHFGSLRDGSMTTVPWGDLEGLVSLPSFHTAGAAIVTWAFRRTPLVWCLLPVNVLLIAATVLLGAHYAVDLLGSGVMLAGSLALYRWTRRQTGFPAVTHRANRRRANASGTVDPVGEFI